MLDKNKAGKQKKPVNVGRQASLQPLVKLQNISDAYGDLRRVQLLDE